MKIKIPYVFLFLLLCTHFSVGQTGNKNPDSIKVYKNIEAYSKRSGFGKFVHKLLFKSTRKKQPASQNIRKKYLIKKSFDKHEGKIIRKIKIETLDPFGYSVDNPDDKPNGFEKFGNSLHVKSKNWTIRNILLIRENQPLDSLLAKESERLVRKQRFTRSVVIKPIDINSKDSVDISVRVLDSWSLIPTGSISSSRGTIELTERNFMGLGHEIEYDYTNRFADKKNARTVSYGINNFRNTFINTTLLYQTTLNDAVIRSAKMERRFYSPFTRFAGGILFENKKFYDSIPDVSGNFETFQFKNETRDFWFGHSQKIFKGRNEDYRTTNLITSIGYKKIEYLNSPTAIFDSSNYFSNEELYLASIGLNTRKFAEDKYLFNYGIIEDVPYGQVYSITGGFQNKNFNKRAYFGARFAYGDYFSFGYISSNFEWGSFFNNGCTEETTFKVEANYFTNLLPLGSWKIRQFIKPTIVFGNHRAPIIKDRVTLEDQDGISGFGNPLINGTKKFTLALQTQTYVPGNWHGFRFSPFYNMTFGFLGDETNKILNDKMYSKFSIGVLINNDYLVFNSFQISISYYPSIPFEGTNLFKTNTLKNNDLSLPDYEIGQPNIVNFK